MPLSTWKLHAKALYEVSSKIDFFDANIEDVLESVEKGDDHV